MSEKISHSDRQANYLSLKRLSIRHLIQNQLFDLTAFESTLVPEDIPVYRLKHPTAVIYRTSMLRKFGPKIKNDLVNKLSQETVISLPRQDLTYKLTASNDDYIDFHFTFDALTQWLRHLSLALAMSQVVQPATPKPESPDLFICQYSHARCCSILRLAGREGLIPFFDCLDINRQAEQVNYLLLLAFNHFETFLLLDSYEKSLALEMLSAVDSFGSQRATQWQMIALNLCQTFLGFERYCRIFGQVKRENPKLAQSRLWLMALFQRLLQKLLQEKLGIIPLTQL